MSGKRPGWQYSDSLAALIACAKATKDAPTLVLATLCQHADAKGMCFPSLPTIANETGVSRATAHRAIEKLINLGLIVRVVGGGRRSSTYKLKTPAVSKLQPLSGIKVDTPAVSKLTPQQYQHADTPGVSPVETLTRLIELKQEEPLKRVLPASSGTVGEDGRSALEAAPASPIANSPASAPSKAFTRDQLASLIDNLRSRPQLVQRHSRQLYIEQLRASAEPLPEGDAVRADALALADAIEGRPFVGSLNFQFPNDEPTDAKIKNRN